MKSFVSSLCLVFYYFALTSSLGTEWERCSLLSSSDRCFKTKLQEIVVQVGNPGTNDDVTLTICSDYEKTDCCTTPALKSKLSNDWSKDDLERWSDRYFGPCKDKEFKVREKVIATLRKNGNGKLNVTSLVLETKSPEKKVKETERFDCKNFNLGGDQKEFEVKDCPTSPYTFQKLSVLEVQMGNDGTDDDVTLKICSDINDICCSQKLSHTFSDDWKKNNKEIWTPSDFEECSKILFKVKTLPIISLSKNGADDLKVETVAYELTTNGQPAIVTRVACGGFSISGECKNEALCKQPLSNCNTRQIPQSTLERRNSETKSTNKKSRK